MLGCLHLDINSFLLFSIFKDAYFFFQTQSAVIGTSFKNFEFFSQYPFLLLEIFPFCLLFAKFVWIKMKRGPSSYEILMPIIYFFML